MTKSSSKNSRMVVRDAELWAVLAAGTKLSVLF